MSVVDLLDYNEASYSLGLDEHGRANYEIKSKITKKYVFQLA